MSFIELRYGHRTIPFEFDEARFEVLEPRPAPLALSDAELGAKLDEPLGSERLDELVSAGDSVLIVVPDATREVGCGQIVNLLVRRLIAAGVNAFDIRIIFATGIHRAVTEEEKQHLLTPFIAQRIKTLDHAPRDLMGIVNLGETTGGIPIGLNRALTEHDHVILIGGVSFHYFAGFTGGRKLVCPGLASAKTVTATHKLAFDCATRSRREGVGTARLAGNPVHQAFLDVCAAVNISFCITTDVNERGEITELHCGGLQASHEAACERFAASHTVEIAERRAVVIASCGGSPFDVDMIQAHKTLDAAANACAPGGTIILVAECEEGVGRSELLEWFALGSSENIAERLCEKYSVTGQTAWSILRKTESFDVRILTSLPAVETEMMRMTTMQSLARAVGKTKKETTGYILPFGAKTLVRVAV